MFQIAQPAMDQLGGGGGRAAAEIGLLAQKHRPAAPGGIPRDAGAIDAAADDDEVETLHGLIRVGTHPVSYRPGQPYQ